MARDVYRIMNHNNYATEKESKSMKKQNNDFEDYQLNIIPNQSLVQPLKTKSDLKENINSQDPSVSVDTRNDIENAKFISTVKEVESGVTDSEIKNDESKNNSKNPLSFISKMKPNSQKSLLDKLIGGFKEKRKLL